MRTLVLEGGAIGSDPRTVRLVRALTRLGEVDVLGLGPAADVPAGVRFHELSGYDFRPRGIVGRLRPHRRFDGFVERAPDGPFDLVLAIDIPVLRPAARLAKERGAKLVYGMVELWPRLLDRMFRPSTALKRLLVPPVLKSAGRAALREEEALLPSVELSLLVGSEATDWFLGRYGPENTLRIVAYPPRLDPLPEGRLRREFGIGASDRVVLYRGPLSRGRALTSLVRAVAAWPADVHLVLVGRGSLESRLHLSAGAPDLAGRVHFAGPVPPGDRPSLLVDADLGVALRETPESGSLTPCFEFMAAGVPFLVTDTPEVRRFLADCEAGRATGAETTADLVSAVNDVLREPGEMRRLGGIGRQAHLDRYHWEVEEARLLEAIEKIGVR